VYLYKKLKAIYRKSEKMKNKVFKCKITVYFVVKYMIRYYLSLQQSEDESRKNTSKKVLT